MQETKNRNTGLVIIGYIFSLLSILIMPLLFGLIGFVIGLINLNRDEVIHGLIQITLSIGFAFAGSMIGGPGFGLPKL